MRLNTVCVIILAARALGCSDNPSPSLDATTDHAADVTDATMDSAPDASIDALDDLAPDVPHADVLIAPDIMRTQPDSVLALQRASCTFTAGAWPAETLGTDIPLGDDIPIDHVFILLQENRSFDSYYGHLPQGTDGGATIDEPPPGWFNPDATGAHITPYHDTQYCLSDLDHSWGGAHTEWNGGANDHFVTQNDPIGTRAMAYYDATDIPFYYSLATTFAIGDEYHSSLLGPTFPNRYYSFAATSFGHTASALVTQDSPVNLAPQIFLELDHAGVDWKDYAGGPRAIALFVNFILRSTTVPHLDGLDGLMNDIADGTVPPFSFVEPVFGGSTGAGNETDEHPPGSPMAGEQWVETFIRALMASSLWQRSVVFIAYDEDGGFADHVPPPAACPPDAIPPTNDDGTPAGFDFAHYGFRVPFTIVSPYARPGYVSHTVYDHTSLLRFVEARFGLPAMTARDANATPPMDAFDFSHPAFMTPPTLAPSTYPASVRAACNAAFPTG